MNIHQCFVVAGLLASALATAHESTDWRTDQKAFASYFMFSAPFAANETTPGSQLRFEINQDELRAKLSEFSGASEVEIGGERTRIAERGSDAGRQLARRYLKQEYERLGFRVSEHSYGTGINFVAERDGRDTSKVLIVSSHLDSVGNAGADDDGSGTISALALAKALSGYSLKNNLRIVAFDEEEAGLVGSTRYVRELVTTGKLGEVVADVNLEMTGYNQRKDGAFHVIDCSRPDSTPFTDFVLQAVAREQLPLQRTSACTDRSDHASFWKKGKAAIVISQNFFGGDSNPCYHESCDQIDIVDFGYMENITRAVTSAVGAMLQAQ